MNELKLEYVINKNLVNNFIIKLNKDILPIRKKKELIQNKTKIHEKKSNKKKKIQLNINQHKNC